MTETAQGHAELLSLVKRAQLIVDDAYENWHAAAAAALSTPIAVTEAHIDLVLDAAGDYMGVQYGNAALLHPTDRARIKATLSRPQEEAFRTVSPETQAQLDAIDANIRNAAIMAPHIIVGSATPRERFSSSNIMWSMDNTPLLHDPRGEWVRYIDHADALAALRAELAAAQETITTGIEQEQHLMSRLGIETRAREAAEAEVARLKDGIEQALKNVAYKAGDHPIVPIKYNAFEAAIRSLTAAKGG